MRLTDEQMQLDERLGIEYFTFRTSLDAESDRGCALFAAAYLDQALGNLLRRCLVQGKKLDEDLFSSQSPLASFSSRIKFAYYLGKLDNEARRDLDIIRSIRNDFAHHPESMSFDTQSVRDRCKNLKHIYKMDGSPRVLYTGAVAALLAKIRGATVFAEPLPERKFTTDMDIIRREVQAQTKELLAALESWGQRRVPDDTSP